MRDASGRRLCALRTVRRMVDSHTGVLQQPFTVKILKSYKKLAQTVIIINYDRGVYIHFLVPFFQCFPSQPDK